MVPDAIFIVKFNTRPKKLSKFYLSLSILWQGYQIVNNDVLLDRSIQYLSEKVLFDGSGSHFHSEIQHPASEKVWKFHLSAHNLWQSCQIAFIDIPSDRSTQYPCNKVLDDGSGSHFRREIHPAKKKVWIFHLSAHNLWQGCQIAIIGVSLDRSALMFCNVVLGAGSGRHFYSEIQDPA